jgi:hypothetical protein
MDVFLKLYLSPMKLSDSIMSRFLTKSCTEVIPACTIFIVILSGYFSLLTGGLMIGLGGTLIYQSLQNSKPQKTIINS